MRRLLVLSLLFASPLFAQDSQSAARAAAGCGPDSVQFDVKVDKSQHPSPQPESGKALVYVFEEERWDGDKTKIGAVTTRVGLDGAWVGANHGQSYFTVAVDPGDHRICSAWQSSLKRWSKLASAVSFTAESGRILYYRVIVDERTTHQPSIRLEPVDPAEALLIIGNSGLSSSKPKKS